jgi:pimeloyl-ACP methyl ester carboxylesterase
VTPSRTGRAKVGAIDLAFDVFDGGPRRMVLVMGIGAQRVFWDDRLCGRLADRGFAVVRFDHRDIGESTRLDALPVPRPGRVLARALVGLSIDAPYTLSDMASDVIGLVDHLGWDRVHVVGASMGGMIAQHLGFEHGARLASLTSIMSTTGARRYTVRARPRAMRALLGKPPRTADEAGRVRRVAVPHDRRAGVRGRRRRAASPRATVVRAQAVAARVLPPLRRHRALGRSHRAPRHHPHPSLVFHGEDDPLLVVAGGRATARAIPGARLHVVPGMGHHMPPGVWDQLVPAITDNAARA